ncbi:protein translocase subunit SecD [Planctomicrobium sp. SH668]|uniref:protein translocase subunit SecD n=1 Tax=Planctomicrobium sp. SH668 TaxID=3448126 RepID=UPI003F5C6DE8
MNWLSMNLLLAFQETTITAADAADTAASSTAIGGTAGWLVFLVVAAVIVVPFVLGSLIAQALKLKEYSTRLGIILFTLTLALCPFVTSWIATGNPANAISLGIDLAGGTNMVFAVDKEETAKAGKEINNEVMDKMVTAVSRRVNPTGTEEVTVRRVGADRIEVIVPGADEDKKNQTRRLILDLGKLEFAIVANSQEADHTALIAAASKLSPDQDEVYRGTDLIGKFRQSAIATEHDFETDKEVTGPKVLPGGSAYTRTVTRNGKEVVQFLLAVDPDPSRRITGELLKSVREQVGQKGLSVGFTFNDRGGHLMQQITSRYQPRESGGYRNQLAVLLNEELHSAPVIEDVIGSVGEINGGFTQEQIDELVSVLNAGALQVPLYPTPVSEFTVSPTLGTDVQRKGLTAMAVSMVAVFVITAGYYLGLGVIADICLVLNLILVLGAMSLIDATFTLPGLAGLVLSIGMAVDSNVLIYERMREERQRGSSVRLAIKNGFEKAFGTIFDSNVTTLITAVILYYVGTDQVKGFAVTLFIGIVISMFTAVYVGRIIFEIADRKGWLTDLKMFQAIPPTKFNFMGVQGFAMFIALAVTIGGLAVTAYRGKDNLDIDFRGGSMVTFKFEGDAPTSEEVRSALNNKFEKSLALERLNVKENGEDRVLFRMRTIEADADVVSKNIVDVFADTPYKLVQQHVETSALNAIPKPAEGEVSSDAFAGGHDFTVKLTQKMLPLSLGEEVVQFLRDDRKLSQPSGDVSAQGVDVKDAKANEILVRLGPKITSEDAQGALDHLVTKFNGAPYFEEINTFDTSVAGDTQSSAIMAIIGSLLAIIAYLWIRFQRVSFGLAACIALLFDVLITLGLVSIGAYLSGNPVSDLLGLEDFKINLTVVASFLTIIGYSLNDKIVVFDRIREVRGRNPLLTANMINQSVNETLSRTLLTSSTTLVVVLVMYFLGGDGIHAFSYCLFLGIVVGTLSSIFIASPALLWLTNMNQKKAVI